jgi:RNA recognition motif-containing protein
MLKPQQQPQRQIFVGNLSYEATEQDLAEALATVGVTVFRVRIVIDQDTNRPRGFAFVDIDRDDRHSVAEVIALVNQGSIMINDRKIRADVAHAKPKREDEKPTLKPRGGRGHARSEASSPRSEIEGLDNEFEWK